MSRLKYKINVLKELKSKGYNTTELRRSKFSNSSLDKIRRGEMVGIKILEQLCGMLDKQPGDIIEYIPKEKEE